MNNTTPAPWKVVHYNQNVTQVKSAIPGLQVCEINHPHWDGRAEADARLIAAAPDLYTALERLTDNIHTMMDKGLPFPAGLDEALNALIAAKEGKKS